MMMSETHIHLTSKPKHVGTKTVLIQNERTEHALTFSLPFLFNFMRKKYLEYMERWEKAGKKCEEKCLFPLDPIGGALNSLISSG